MGAGILKLEQVSTNHLAIGGGVSAPGFVHTIGAPEVQDIKIDHTTSVEGAW